MKNFHSRLQTAPTRCPMSFVVVGTPTTRGSLITFTPPGNWPSRPLNHLRFINWEVFMLTPRSHHPLVIYPGSIGDRWGWVWEGVGGCWRGKRQAVGEWLGWKGGVDNVMGNLCGYPNVKGTPATFFGSWMCHIYTCGAWDLGGKWGTFNRQTLLLFFWTISKIEALLDPGRYTSHTKRYTIALEIKTRDIVIYFLVRDSCG